MRTVNPFAHHEEDRVYSRDNSNRLTHTAERVLVGHCPECAKVLVVFNDHESWPLVACACGWSGATTEFSHVRVEHSVYEPIEVTGYFPEGVSVRVLRPGAAGIEELGEATEVGLVDQRMAGMLPSERGSTNLRARLVVRS